jgi:hypothetical protein
MGSDRANPGETERSLYKLVFVKRTGVTQSV